MTKTALKSKTAADRWRKVDLGKMILSLDRYSAPVELNINGKTRISSYPGSLVSVLMFIILCVYGSQKFQQWIFAQNPTINISTISNHFEADHTVNLTYIGFKIAFGVIDYKSQTALNDSNFVNFNVNLAEFKNGQSVKKTPLAFHKCTQKDFDLFYPPAPSQKQAIENMRSKDFGLYCIDDGQNMTLYGQDLFMSLRLEIFFKPCTQNISTNTCINQTKQSTLDYLGSTPDFVLLQNTKRFDITDYSQDVEVKGESILIQYHMQMLQASVQSAYLKLQQVQDEIKMLHLGNQNSHDLWIIENDFQRPSSANQWTNYYLAGYILFLSPDYEITTRSTYDFLNLLGDVGGLDTVLNLVGQILLNRFQSFNYFAYIISLLFVQSNPFYQSIRSILKPNIFEEEQSTTFKKFKNKTLSTEMLTDFKNRNQISKPTLLEIVFGLICCNKKYKRFLKLYKRGVEKINQELDILKIIKTQKVQQVELWSLMLRSQHQIASKIAEYVLSEFSSEDESSITKHRFKVFPGIFLYKSNVDLEMKTSIEEVLNNLHLSINQQLIEIYQSKDRIRNKLWSRQDPQIAIEQGLKHLKQLIARNFTKPMTDPPSETTVVSHFQTQRKNIMQQKLVFDVSENQLAQSFWNMKSIDD